MVSYKDEVSRNIAAAITHKNRSKKYVAETTGIPYTTFNRKLNTGRPEEFTLTEIASIADVLDMAPTTFLPSALMVGRVA